jgi:hypothetical protein
MPLGGAALPPIYAFSLEQSLDISSSAFVSRLSRAMSRLPGPKPDDIARDPIQL